MKFNTRKIRIFWLVMAVLTVFSVYGVRLMKMQVVDGQSYLEQAKESYSQEQTVPAARGEIMDRNGVLLAQNTTAFNVILDKAFFPKGETKEETQRKMNDIILKTVKILQGQDQEWIDNLPITSEGPFMFYKDRENDVAKLKSFLNIGAYATVEDTIHWLKEQYYLNDYSDEDFRILAGIRYEMDRVGFSTKVRYTLAEDITMETVTKIKENSLDLPGVDTDVSSVREYVNGDVIPHVIGKVGPIYKENYEEYEEKGYPMNAIVGQSGIEALMEEELRGQDGKRELLFNSDGEVVDVKETLAPTPGNNVRLTIDANMQRAAAEMLKQEIEYLNKNAPAGEGREACAGAAVAIEIETGDILALVSYPSYNLETFQEDYESKLKDDPLKPMFNRALLGTYTPGSIFKPVVATAGLETGTISANYTVHCGRVYTYYDDYQPKCLSAHGNFNVINALRKSCNIFFYDTGRRTGIEAIDKYSQLYGLGEPTGIELREETGSRSNPTEREAAGGEWYPGDVLQSSIGQADNKFTPLQLANYCATIARKGQRLDAHIIKQVTDYNTGDVMMQTEAKELSNVEMSESTFKTVLKGMIEAAGANGTSYGEFTNYPVTVAAKTGTPETKEFPNSTYIAFAPAEDPKIALCVVIEKGWHGYTGVPVAKQILNSYFGYDEPIRMIK